MTNLFSSKELYLLAHNSEGHAFASAKLSQHYQRIVHQNNLDMMEGMNFSYIHGFPQLVPYKGPCSWSNIIPFSKRNKCKSKDNVAVHCFEQDYFFATFWNNLDRSIFSLKDYAAVFAPDFTLYVDAPQPVNIWEVYRSRFCGARMQLDGYNVIPTFSYADASSLSWTLEGLPMHSVLGVSGTGLKASTARLKLFQYAMRRAEEELSPILFYVYGDRVPLPGISTEVRFIVPQITKFFRNEYKHSTIERPY